MFVLHFLLLAYRVAALLVYTPDYNLSFRLAFCLLCLCVCVVTSLFLRVGVLVLMLLWCCLLSCCIACVYTSDSSPSFHLEFCSLCLCFCVVISRHARGMRRRPKHTRLTIVLTCKYYILRVLRRPYHPRWVGRGEHTIHNWRCELCLRSAVLSQGKPSVID